MRHANTAIILAGGESKRMGFNKELIKINGVCLVDSLGAGLRAVFEQVIVVSNNQEIYAGKDFEVVSDELPGFGPLGGIHAGLKAARSRYSYVIACDMPNLNLKYIAYLRGRVELSGGEISALVTSFGYHIEPFNAFYNNSLIEQIEKFFATGQRSLARFLSEQHATKIEEKIAREFSQNWEMFTNLNTPEEVEDYIRQ